jgi:hypothetical protein
LSTVSNATEESHAQDPYIGGLSGDLSAGLAPDDIALRELKAAKAGEN